TLQQAHIETHGEWHVTYENITDDDLQTLREDKYTRDIILTRDLGYAALEKNNNLSKPYMFVKQYNDTGFIYMPIEIIEGRQPETDKELLVSEHMFHQAGIDLQIGDMLDLHLGDRKTSNEDYRDYFLNQNFPLLMDNDEVTETVEPEMQKEYEIVGIMKRPTWEPFRAPGYTALTGMSEESEMDASVIWKKVNRKTISHAEELGETLNIERISLNNNLLRYYGIINSDSLRISLYGVVAIVMGIIMIGSIALIYNAFAISVAERTRYLGMLSSVGATKVQKRNSVFFEGLLIGVISIPFGILSGIGGIALTFSAINPTFKNIFDTQIGLQVSVTPMTIIVAVIVTFLTILVSTYIPAKRASKISAIDAIQQVEDIKLTGKQVKTSKLIRSLFGIEADFGLKNMKRNKRRYLATLLSLVISIILFLTVSFFAEQVRLSTELITDVKNYDLMVNTHGTHSLITSDLRQSLEDQEEVDQITEIEYFYAESNLSKDQIHESWHSEIYDDQVDFSLEIYAIDDETLRKYAKEIDVDYEQLIDEDDLLGIAIASSVASSTKHGYIQPLQIDEGEAISISYFDWDREENVEIGEVKIATFTKETPLGIDNSFFGSINIIVSQQVLERLIQDKDISVYGEVALTSSDVMKTHEYLEELVSQDVYIDNPYLHKQEEEGIIFIMKVFTYGFVILIILICVANIFNTISTGIALRRREYAMLKSVGMTPKGFNKMIHYETMFYGIKSLLYGLPISIGIMYLIYKVMHGSFEFPFLLPWSHLLGTTIVVFVIISITMMYSSAKVRKENIIESLKEENI
ncbi:MAG TPA: FtsX-like permease family protein, partial [Bacillota bacterium]|nr:FtsX-like permease family protein [Bacillota bacterium]